MSSSEPARVITLKPGEFTFAEGEIILQTLLGSCVAVTFWEPKRHLGAMCHYLLPVRTNQSDPRAPGYYADETLIAIRDQFHALGIQAESLEVRMFGGSNMFPMLPVLKKRLIGDLNIEAGRYLLEEFGCTLSQVDLAGEVHRKITFEVHTGRVHVELGAKLGSAQGRKR